MDLGQETKVAGLVFPDLNLHQNNFKGGELRCSVMVVRHERNRTVVDVRSNSCMPLTGEDTGLEALASPPVGYLGKIQERAASLEYCPWCTSKGFTYALRSYHINLQESITLCTNPQCLFPLVTRPLEDVLASLHPVEATSGNKRKRDLEVGKGEKNKSLKQLHLSDAGGLGAKCVFPASDSLSENCIANPVTHNHETTPEREDKKVNGPHEDFLDDSAPPCLNSVRYVSGVLLPVGGDDQTHHRLVASFQDHNSTNIKPSPALLSESAPLSEKSQIEDVPNANDCEVLSDTENVVCNSQRKLEKFVAVPKKLLWRNCHNLCWLDSLLAALVNCKSLRNLKDKEEPHSSSLVNFLNKYEDILAVVQAHQHTGEDGVPRVPSDVLQKTNVELHTLRMFIFDLLQPKLLCKLGQRETPVFAMPLLLTMDSWAERLFQTAFSWEFKCAECKAMTKERFIKTLSTFTKVVPGWSPLNAVHFAPCNVCHKKNQRRTMLLESVPPVFALHFVEGLPDTDVSNYAFNFEGKRYSVTTVIQYNQHLKHFVTWICNTDGSWIEYDDLKHPTYKSYEKLPIPPQEMHILFWEVSEDSSLPLTEPPEPEEGGALRPDEPLSCSLLPAHNDIDIICALTEENPKSTPDVDTSLSASFLLDTFEGLNHNDLVHLTLVDIQAASETQNGVEVFPTAGGDTCHSEAEPTTHSSSEVESEDYAKDPTFVPTAKRKRGQRDVQAKEVGRNTRRKTADLPHSPSLEPCRLARQGSESSAGQGGTVRQQPSPASTFENRSPSSSQKTAVPPVCTDQAARWSYLLSRLPVNQINKTNPNLPPTHPPPLSTSLKPSPPVHSIPSAVKVPPFPSVLPKPKIASEEGKGLPPKAAEMYGGFDSNGFNSPLPSPDQTRPTFNHPTSAKLPPLTRISSSKKPGCLSALSETEALRYKLMKKLKAKKKKLAKLNKLLGAEHRGGLRPDSTDLTSPSTVSSSTYDGSTCDDFLSDLLSPATTASSTLSPDSTGLLEMLASGQDGANPVEPVIVSAGQSSCVTNTPDTENFLEEFFSQF